MVNPTSRINENIRASKVRLVNVDGEQLGIKDKKEALSIARDNGLDLVEVAEKAKPPVCRIMDYSKHKYEIAQREKESKKKRTQVVVKEIKYRPKISQGDLDIKTRKVVGFLEDGNRVKVTVMFRGREVQHPEQGIRIIDSVKEATQDFATVETEAALEGRNMTMVLIPDTVAIKNAKKNIQKENIQKEEVAAENSSPA